MPSSSLVLCLQSLVQHINITILASTLPTLRDDTVLYHIVNRHAKRLSEPDVRMLVCSHLFFYVIRYICRYSVKRIVGVDRDYMLIKGNGELYFHAHPVTLILTPCLCFFGKDKH